MHLNTGSLRSRIVRGGLALSLASVLLSSAACGFSSYRALFEKYSHARRIAAEAAVDKANSSLDGILRAFNGAMNTERYDDFSRAMGQGPFASTMAELGYLQYLRDLIIYEDDLDALIVVDARSDHVAVAANNVTVSYSEYRRSTYLAALGRRFENVGSVRPFLDINLGGDKKRLAVVEPILDRDGGRVEAFMIAVLGESFSSALTSLGDGIAVDDGSGGSAWICPRLDDRAEARAFKLNLEGWTLSVDFSFGPIKGMILRSLATGAAIGAALIAAAALALSFFAARIVGPISAMRDEIARMPVDGIAPAHAASSARRLDFKLSVFILYSCVVAAPVFAITLWSYADTRDIAERRISSSFSSSADLLYRRIDLAFRSYSSALSEIAIVDDKIQRLAAGPMDAEGVAAMRGEVNRLLATNHRYGRDIENIRFYDLGFRLLYSSYYASAFIRKAESLEDLEFIRGHFGRKLWRFRMGASGDATYAEVGMQVRGASEGVESGKLLGYMIIDFRISDARRMINEFLQYGDVRALLVDSEGRDVFMQDDEYIADLGIGGELASVGGTEGPSSVAFHKGGDRYRMTIRTFPENDWRLVFILKNFDENASIVYYSFALLAALLALSLGVSFGLTTFISSGISNLIKTVRRVDRGELDARFRGRATDEIGELGMSFNRLLDRLALLMEEKYRSEMTIKDTEIRLKEYELNYLQAQINPHFLYNTLKTVQYMVYSGDPRAERMVKLLIALFKMGVARGERVVRVEDELRHVSTYLEIQGIRFAGRFESTIDVESAALDLPILKLTLQPIVENAIQHGLEISERKGSLAIVGRIEGGTLRLEVRDTGAGMRPELLERLRGELRDVVDTAGVGLANVNARLRLYYGEPYGLAISSVLGEGTVVTISLPATAALPAAPSG